MTGSRSGGGCPKFSEAIHAAISPIVLGAIKDVPESTKNLFASVDLARRLGLRLRAYWLDIGRGGRRPNLARYRLDLGFAGVGRHGPGQDDHGPQLRQGPPGLRQPDPGRQAGRLLGRAIDPVRHQVGDEVDRLDPDGRRHQGPAHHLRHQAQRLRSQFRHAAHLQPRQGLAEAGHRSPARHPDRRVPQDRGVRGAAVPAGHRLVLQRRRSELAGRPPHPAFQPGPAVGAALARADAHAHQLRQGGLAH